MVDRYVFAGDGTPTTQKVEIETATYSGQSPTYAFLSEGGSITTSPGDLVALVVSEGSDVNSAALSITLWDNSISGGTAIVTAFPVASGNVYDFHNVRFTTGLFATFVNSATSSYAISVLYRNI